MGGPRIGHLSVEGKIPCLKYFDTKTQSGLVPWFPNRIAHTVYISNWLKLDKRFQVIDSYLFNSRLTDLKLVDDKERTINPHQQEAQ